MKDERRWQSGEHTVLFEPPDVLVMTLRGVVSRDEMEQLLATRAVFTSEDDRFMILSDIRAFSGVSIEASRLLAESADLRLCAVALVGANFRTRVIAEMAIRAANIFEKHQTQYRFTDDERAARAWLAEVRQKGAAC